MTLPPPYSLHGVMPCMRIPDVANCFQTNSLDCVLFKRNGFCLNDNLFAFAGMPCDEQRVVFNGKQLEDCDLLSVAGVEDEATLNILGRLLGGAKKRKKKTYTKPKKLKHKHKKIKLRVLKFYKVNLPIIKRENKCMCLWGMHAHVLP